MTPAPLRSILPGLEWLLRGETITVFKTSAFVAVVVVLFYFNIGDQNYEFFPKKYATFP